MDPIHVVITLGLIGVILWAANTYLPMQPPFKQIMNILAILFTALWLLNGFGIFHF